MAILLLCLTKESFLFACKLRNHTHKVSIILYDFVSGVEFPFMFFMHFYCVNKIEHDVHFLLQNCKCHLIAVLHVQDHIKVLAEGTKLFAFM